MPSANTANRDGIGYIELFKTHPDFTRLFVARNISLLGDWFNTLAILALLREGGDDSAASFAFVLVFKTLPSLFVAPIGGVLSDRISRRSIMMATDFLRFFVVGAMLLPVVTSNLSILYFLVILQSAGSAFAEPARSALIPDLVSKKNLLAAGAMTATAWSLMLALGSALGGASIEAFGWEVTLSVDALTYLVSFVLLLSIKARPIRNNPIEHPPGWKTTLGISDLIEGGQFLASRPRIASMAGVKGLMGFAAGALVLLLTIYGEQVYTMGEKGVLGVALLYTARSLGTGMGPILSRVIVKGSEKALELAIFVGFLVGSAGYAFFPLVGHITLAFICVTFAHLGGATLWVFSTVRLQQMTPAYIRGRVFASEHALMTLTSALSTIFFAYLLDFKVMPLPWIAQGVSLILLFAAFIWGLRLLLLGAARTS